MDCPKCNTTVKRQQMSDGSLQIYCSACGWGLQNTSAGPGRESPGIGFGKLSLFWLLSLVIIVAPYAGLRFGVPYMGDVGIESIDNAIQRFLAGLDIHYWWVFALYVFLGGAITPKYDPDNIGWMGGFMDNPFSWEDDYNRGMRTLAMILFPGKVVWHTGAMTIRKAMGRA